MKNKRFQQAIWEIRKQYNCPSLTKRQLSEAYDLYIKAEENIARFKNLMVEMIIKEETNTLKGIL